MSTFVSKNRVDKGSGDCFFVVEGWKFDEDPDEKLQNLRATRELWAIENTPMDRELFDRAAQHVPDQPLHNLKAFKSFDQLF